MQLVRECCEKVKKDYLKFLIKEKKLQCHIADIANFTNTKPIMLIGETVG